MFKARIRKNGLASLYFSEGPSKYSRTAINLTGIPTITDATPAVPFIVSLGYNVFQPQYFGSFDSEGVFTPENTIKTVFEMDEQVMSGSIFDLKSEQEIAIQPTVDLLISHSFGTYSGVGAIIRGFAPRLSIMFSPMFEFGVKREEVGLILDLEKHARHITRALPLTFRQPQLYWITRLCFPFLNNFFKEPKESRLRYFFVEQDYFHPHPERVKPRRNKTRILAIVGGQDPSLDASRNKVYTERFIRQYSHIMELVEYIIVPEGGHSVRTLLTPSVRAQVKEFVLGS